MEKDLYDRQQLVSSLAKIGHGNLEVFEQAGLPAAIADAELFAHLTAWNAVKGEVRDSKVAYPPIGLRGCTKATRDFAENAVAHMMLLGPRELVRSYHFSKDLTKKGKVIPAGYRRMLERALKMYVQVREAKRSWWDKAVVRNRQAMVELYAISHTKPAPFAQEILFEHKYPENSVFHAIAHLKEMSPQEAAGAILNYEIPMPIAMGAVSKKSPDALLAMVEKMSGNELINSANMLKKAGVMSDPVLKSAFGAALVRAKDDTRVSTLKASKAAESLDEDVGKKIMAVQNARLEKLGGIEGDWVVLGDCSGSMSEAIEAARQIASLIAQQVKGKVYLVFFNTMPRFVDVTGCTLEQIQKATQHFTAGGGTSIGCGLEYIREKGIIVNGIAIVSDGGDNTHPLFSTAYQRYEEQTGMRPTVYLFHMNGNEANHLDGYCKQAGIELTGYELGDHVDYYSVANLVPMLRTSRFSLLDSIMSTPLVTLAQVFD